MDKQFILEEIKRTAKANDGIPLGKARFSQVTGIKDSAWFGKFWIRWNDAVKEAGLTPNKMTIAYDEDLLIDKFIAFTRELGHFPIAPELRLRSHQDKNFPNTKTFETRWGTKQQVAQRITDYCKQHEGYEDVLLLCEPVLNIKPQKQEVVPNDVTIGFVYLIKSGRYYKIGRSAAVGRREYEIALQLPEKLNTVHTIRTDDPVGIEAYWHKRFEAKRKNGEWFELSSADVNVFRRRTFM